MIKKNYTTNLFSLLLLLIGTEANNEKQTNQKTINYKL